MSELKERSEIGEEFKWNLNGLFSDETLWEEAFDKVDSPLESLLALKGILVESAENLATCIELEDKMDGLVGHVFDPVMRELIQLMNDSFMRFKQTDDYSKLMSLYQRNNG